MQSDVTPQFTAGQGGSSTLLSAYSHQALTPARGLHRSLKCDDTDC
uniref:Uncharacterized protein n=1 Tax=Anguilla anguilla TaxID=7936 RepID=A0A0E9SSE9_ANGAN